MYYSGMNDRRIKAPETRKCLMKNALITVCARKGSDENGSKNLKKLCGYPIVYYSLSAADLYCKNSADVNTDICLNTDIDELAALVLGKYPEVHHIKRSARLSGESVPKEDVYRDCILKMEKKLGKKYDFFIDLDITSPLRKDTDIKGIVDQFLSDPDADVVMSASESRRNPYYNMAQIGNDGFARRIIDNRNTASVQAPVCYDVNASLYVFSRDFLINRMTFDLWQGKVKLYIMSRTGTFDIGNGNEYGMMEASASYLFENVEGYKKIRDNIRK